ncbi:hypothetical protein SERLA73DRAFT_179808 [Serpula lacrymans var. lacrymans S7.3]|uniref:Secreted protein n=1 Tax=Serpula lacrymans var. lacrymans (strain S7.3) TaxID=936435 RepID=F8PUF4_SERL3|nr:hypothetical protein SERLA73DRAFT_179808 [Serpula lacrymans var. lacrymans S7.3]
MGQPIGLLAVCSCELLFTAAQPATLLFADIASQSAAAGTCPKLISRSLVAINVLRMNQSYCTRWRAAHSVGYPENVVLGGASQSKT